MSLWSYLATCRLVIYAVFTSLRISKRNSHLIHPQDLQDTLQVNNLYCLALEALQHRSLLFKLDSQVYDINYFSMKGNTQQIRNTGPGSTNTEDLRSQLSFDQAMLEVNNY